MTAPRDDDIVIVGMGCRLPGGIHSPGDLWDRFDGQWDGWTKIPATRFNPQAYHHPNPGKHGSFNSGGAYFLKEDISLFDAHFFNITASEAHALDPQQRLILECTYEALENAGMPLEAITGSNTGVFVGASASDYAVHMLRDVQTTPMFHGTGSAEALLSNRISYTLDLKGPSVTSDTACSSALSSLHLACQSLRAGDANQAIVGSCHLNLTPDSFVSLSKSRLLSPEGRSYAFDHRATSGYGRGEGVAAIVLKTRRQAMEDGDTIRAVILASGMNQDGKTAGITLPNGQAQADLIRKVYAKSGLNPLDTGYVEAHGTGTAIGDPIEAEALASVFSPGRSAENPMYLGSLKSQVGHLEGASGIASIVKTVLVLEHGTFLPNANFEKPNPQIPLDEWNFKVPTSKETWTPSTGHRVASVNSFGFGGSNVHIILQEATLGSQNGIVNNTVSVNGVNGVNGVNSVNGVDSVNGVNGHATNGYTEALKVAPLSRRLYVLSAKSEESLLHYAPSLAAYLDRDDLLTNVDIDKSLAYTLASRRSKFQWRLAVSSATVGDLAQTLNKEKLKPTRATAPPMVCFVFTGQGAQWLGMGRELITQYPVFSRSIERADELCAKMGASWSLTEEISFSTDHSASKFASAEVSQPACTAIQLALTVLLDSWGVKPQAVTGHSSGEIAAAFAAGNLSFEDAMTLSYQRGIASAALKIDFPELKGAMLALGTNEEDATTLLSTKEGSAIVACINSPSSVTISGDEIAISKVEEKAQSKGLFNRRLRVDMAYHSHHMELVAGKYLKSISGIEHNSGDVAFHSSLTGSQENMANENHSYWAQNLTQPVKFRQALENLYSSQTTKGSKGNLVIVEIGPHNALEGPIKQTLDKIQGDSAKTSYFPTLSRQRDSVEQLQNLAGNLFQEGHPIDFAAINLEDTKSKVPVLVDLPTYSWDHSQKYWHSTRIGQNHQLRSFGRNDILGSMTDECNELEPTWRCVLDPDEVPWLRHHRVQGQTIFPIAGYLAMSIEAANQRAKMDSVNPGEFRLREIVSSRAMIIEEAIDTEIMTSLRPFNQTSKKSSDTWSEIRIFSWSSRHNWIEHFRALVSVSRHQDQEKAPTLRRRDLENLHHQETVNAHEKQCSKKVEWTGFVEMFSRIGIDFGPTFQTISNVVASEDMSISNVEVADTAQLMPSSEETEYIIHPTTLDMCCQGIFPAFTHGLTSLRQTYMPTFIKSLVIRPSNLSNRPGDQFKAYWTTTHSNAGEITGSGIIYDTANPDDAPAIVFSDTVLTPLSFGDTETVTRTQNELCSRISWEPSIDLWNEDRLSHMLSTKDIPESEQSRVRVHDRASLYYIQQTLDEILPAEYNTFHSYHKKFYDWMKDQLSAAEQGLLPTQDADWLSADQQTRQDFLDGVKNYNSAGLMICSMGEALPRILRQQVDPLSIMVHDDLLTKWYRYNISLEVGYAQTANIVNTIAHQNPFLNIIEIGAGTGGITLPILEALGGHDGRKPRFRNYTYTDISTGFFEGAQKRFEQWESLMTYARLDIEKDPLEQGFQEGTFDLVVAANVLHATTDMRVTLANAAKLLKPGGKLVLIELTRMLLHHFMFATLPGWWLSKEDFRAKAPIMPKARWDDLLKESGFSGVSIYGDDFPGQPEQSGSLMISERVEVGVDESQPQVVIVCDTVPKLLNPKDLQAELHARLDAVSTVESVATADVRGKWCIFLEELNRPMLSDITSKDFEKIQSLISAGAHGILWVVQDSWTDSLNPNTNLIFGLARTVRNETSCKLAVLDLEASVFNKSKAQTVAEILGKAFIQADSAINGETELIERNGVVQVPRVYVDDKINKVLDRNLNQASPEQQPLIQDGRPLKMRFTSPGHLDSMCFEDDPIAGTELKDDEVEISVKATSLNFKDILIGLGQVPYEDPGLECAGLVVSTGKNVSDIFPGDRVCACVFGSFANYVRCPASNVGKLADHVSYAEGASVPAVYATAYYGLRTLAQLQPGESVLIHAAAGGVGQAAITIAQLVGATIFATVSTDEKKAHLVNHLGIPEANVFYSRDISFKDNIIRATKQKGVDVVLNSLGGDLLHASWEALAPFGRFIELGKLDLQLNSRLEMSVLLRNTSFTSVDLGALREHKPGVFSAVLREVLDLYQTKKLRAVTPLNTFSFSELHKAFRLMEGGKHIGKIVVAVTEGDEVLATVPRNQGTKLRPDATYLITGGSGGIGRSLSKWMVLQGAKYIVLASRSGPRHGKSQALIKELAEMGATLVVQSCDVTSAADMERLVKDSEATMPPIRGAIHGAMVLKDTLFENSDVTHFRSILAPKVDGAWNLHNALAGKELEFFILLGSMAGIVGNRGQAAYNSTSSFLNAFAEYRAKQGLPAICLDLGVVEDVGYIAENAEAKLTLTDMYTDMFEGEKRLNVTEKKLHALVQASIDGDIENGASVLTGIWLKPGDAPTFWEADPKFAHYRRAAAATETEGVSKGKEIPVKQLLATARTPESIYKIFIDSIIAKTSTMLMIPLDDIEASESITEYGLDSLVAVEIRNWMARDLGATLTLIELLTSPSIELLAENVASKSTLVDQRLLQEKSGAD